MTPWEDTLKQFYTLLEVQLEQACDVGKDLAVSPFEWGQTTADHHIATVRFACIPPGDGAAKGWTVYHTGSEQARKLLAKHREKQTAAFIEKAAAHMASALDSPSRPWFRPEPE